MSIAFAFHIALKTRGPLRKKFFVLEFPEYAFPSITLACRVASDRALEFIRTVGTTILLISIALNIMNSINYKGHIVKQKELSIVGSISKTITPVFKPIGIKEDNWEATMALISGIFAKEIVISTLMTLYKHEKENRENIYKVMSKKFGGQSEMISYLIFVLLYFPCFSVFTVIKKELGLKYALLSALITTFIAYFAASLFYQLSIYTNANTIGLQLFFNFLITLFIVTNFCIFLGYIVKKFHTGICVESNHGYESSRNQ